MVERERGKRNVSHKALIQKWSGSGGGGGGAGVTTTTTLAATTLPAAAAFFVGAVVVAVCKTRRQVQHSQHQHQQQQVISTATAAAAASAPPLRPRRLERRRFFLGDGGEEPLPELAGLETHRRVEAFGEGRGLEGEGHAGAHGSLEAGGDREDLVLCRGERRGRRRRGLAPLALSSLPVEVASFFAPASAPTSAPGLGPESPPSSPPVMIRRVAAVFVSLPTPARGHRGSAKATRKKKEKVSNGTGVETDARGRLFSFSTFFCFSSLSSSEEESTRLEEKTK